MIHLVLQAVISPRVLLLASLAEPFATMVLRVKRSLARIWVSAVAAPAYSPEVDAASAPAKPFCGSAGAACVQPAVLGRRMFTLLVQLK